MDPLVAVVMFVVIILVFGGIWGTVLISGLMKRRSNLLAPQDEARLKELAQAQQMLEARLVKLEDEVSFLRELKKPDAAARLESGDR